MAHSPCAASLSSCSALWNRRDALRVGALTIAGALAPAGWSSAAEEPRTTGAGGTYGKAKSVIFLWMAGGVTHIDSFDPKPSAPVEVRGTLGDIATAFDPETEPSVEDIYQASTWGIDVLAGVPIEVGKQKLTPYAAVGYLDASTQFFVGDDSYYANNLHPYAGAAFSVGLDTLLMKHLRLAAEFYGAPGGYSTPDKTVESVDQGSRYGHLYTARARIGVEF